MISVKSGRPIAKVVGNSDYNLIMVQVDKPKALKRKSGKSLEDFSKRRKLPKDDSDEGNEETVQIEDSDLSSDDDLSNVASEDYVHKRTGSYRKTQLKYLDEEDKKIMKEKLSYQISIFEGFMTPVPNIESERDVLYIAGPSGSGKSTYTRRYLINYLKVYPDNMINIFSCVGQDKAFDDLPNVYRIPIDEKLANITMDTLANSCCVFDDIDVVSNEGVRKILQNLRDQTLEIGRHNHITVCATSHQLMNYKATRVLLNEATSVTVFPKSGSSYHIRRYCTQYAGLSKKAIDKLLDLPSRWITLTRTAPMFVLHEKGVIMLSSLDDKTQPNKRKKKIIIDESSDDY